MRVAVAVPAAMLVAATGGPCQSQSPSGAPRAAEPRLEFTVTGSVEGAGPDTVAVTRVTADSMMLEGTMSAPNPCYSIEPSLSSQGSSLRLSLAATARPMICPQVLVRYRYEARITALPPGTYTLAVTYAYPNTGWERRVFELTAQVTGR